MEMLNKEEQKKLDAIINYVKESNDYKNLMIYKDKISKNDSLKKLINEVKKYEQKYIKLGKNKELKDKLDLRIKELESYNDYVMYNYYLERVNSYLDLIKNKINNYFDDLFNVELF